MTLPANKVVRVVCAAESHAPKVVIVARLRLVYSGQPDRWILQAGERSQRLIAEQLIDHKELFGTSRRGPARWDHDQTRERRILRCKLCGLRVDLREESARRITDRLLAAGVSVIRLSELAANL